MVRGLDARGMLHYTVTTPKANATYYVRKTEDGFSRYEIALSNGKLPQRISGYYTTADKGLEVLLDHIERMSLTSAARRDKMYLENKKKREKRLGSDIQPDSKHEVQ